MKCTRCGKNTAQIFTRNIGGKETKVTLCPACFQTLYPEGEDAFFSSLVGVDAGKRCPVCGTSLADFRSSGLLGCANCYSVFREDLIPTIQYLHGKVRHKGTALNVDEAKYDMVRALVSEQERIKGAIERARERGDGAKAERLEGELRAIQRRLLGEDDE